MRIRAAQLAFVPLALTLFGCKPEGAGAQAPSAARESVEVAPSQAWRAPLQRSVRATGTLYGEESVTIAAKVPGRVAEVFHDVGDVLAPWTTLVQLEKVDFELALNERRRAFEQSLARLGLEALPEGEIDVEKLPAVERARLQAENGHARYERGRLLRERVPPAMSEQDYLDLKTAWSVAQADHRIAQLAARAQLAEARAQKAQIESAEQRLVDTLHVVPGAQRAGAEYAVAQRRVSVGDLVNVGAPLFDLVDLDPLELRVRLPERHGREIAVGQRVQIKVDSHAGAFEGRVARLSPAVDVRTRTFEIEISVPNAERELRPGSFATAEIDTLVEPNVLLVERASVTTFAGVHKVFLIVDGIAQERVVELGPERDGNVEVLKGLQGGESIARRPRGLVTGTPLRVVFGGGEP
ncbi:MAG: efflux RND transporter periplasmic adaptor subunit [Planctomycetota bacterium]|nr:efflux RND transporter periplasmic adaptor subunit [Planctomycetota bacterium]